MECEIEDCKANMEHRLGIHSNWCPNFSVTDKFAKDKLLSGVRQQKATKIELMTQ